MKYTFQPRGRDGWCGDSAVSWGWSPPREGSGVLAGAGPGRGGTCWTAGLCCTPSALMGDICYVRAAYSSHFLLDNASKVLVKWLKSVCCEWGRLSAAHVAEGYFRIPSCNPVGYRTAKQKRNNRAQMNNRGAADKNEAQVHPSGPMGWEAVGQRVRVNS